MEVTTMAKFGMIKFKVVGTRPLMCSNPASMSDDGKGEAKEKKIYVPEEEAEIRVYRTEDGKHFYFPSAGFRKCLLQHLSTKKMGKSSAATHYQPNIFTVEEECILIHPKTEKPLKNYVIDSRRVVVGKGKAIKRHRPKFLEWGCFINFNYNTDALSPKIIEKELSEAGERIGVGEFRVSRGGHFGSFSVKLCK